VIRGEKLEWRYNKLRNLLLLRDTTEKLLTEDNLLYGH
jgi:hypothetical protein